MRDPSAQAYMPLVAGAEEPQAQLSDAQGQRVTRAQVLRWFEDRDNHADALHVLNKLEQKRWPEVFGSQANAEANLDTPSRRSHRHPTLAPQKTTDALKGACIQFANDSRHAKEDDSTVTLLILKLGDLSESSEVEYYSEEIEETQQTHEQVRAKAVFVPNQSMCKIEVKIKDQDSWARCRSFVVKLRDPVNATLMEQLKTVYVNVYDKDHFPSNRYIVGNTQDDAKTEVDGLLMLWEYFKMAWGDRKVYNATRWRCLMVQAQNVHGLVTLIAVQFLVDRVLTENSFRAPKKGLLPHISDGGYQFHALVAINAAFVLMVALEHFAAYMKLSVSVGGPLRRNLQLALLERMTYYTEESLSSLTTGKFVMAMARDSLSLVSECHNKIIEVYSILGEIFALLAYFIMSPVLFGRDFHPVILIVVIGYPFLLAIILYWRRRPTYEATRALNAAQDEFVSTVVSILHRAQLFLGYRQRPAALQWTRDKINAYNAARKKSNLNLMHNLYYVQWVTQFASVGVSVYFGSHVLDKTMSIGVYLVSVSATRKLGRAWTKMYMVVNHVDGMTPQLKSVAGLLNADSDLSSLEARDVQGNQHIEKIHRDSRHIDHIHTKHDASCQHEHGLRTGKRLDEEPIRMLREGVQCVIPQGQLVAMFGPGKGAVLKHISATSPLPDQRLFGQVRMPPHLHVVFVSREVEFTAGTLYENLTFGVPDSRKESEMERVLHICRELDIHEGVMDAIRNFRGRDPSLSITQLTLLHLARALIADPEVMCVDRPATMLPPSKTRKVFEVLKRFVRQRGLGHAEDDVYARRARTCIFSCSAADHDQLGFAHLVLRVNNDGTLSEQ